MRHSGQQRACSSHKRRPPRPAEVQPGHLRPAPSLDGIDSWLNWPTPRDVGTHQLQDLFDSGARIVVVDFFAYSCTNCIRVFPVLKTLREEFHPYLEVTPADFPYLIGVQPCMSG